MQVLLKLHLPSLSQTPSPFLYKVHNIGACPAMQNDMSMMHVSTSQAPFALFSRSQPPSPFFSPRCIKTFVPPHPFPIRFSLFAYLELSALLCQIPQSNYLFAGLARGPARPFPARPVLHARPNNVIYIPWRFRGRGDPRPERNHSPV